MKFAKIIVLVFAFWGINSCQDPCEIDTSAKPLKVIGNIPLNESFYYLNHPNDSIEFKFVNNIEKVLSLKKIKDTTNFITRSYLGRSQNKDKCNTLEAHYYSTNILYEYNRFEGVEFPYHLSLVRHNSNITSIDSFIAYRNWRFRDQAYIEINHSYIDLPFNENNSCTYNFHETLTINNKSYNKVYHVWDSSTHLNYRTDIFPRGAYYNLEKGVLGFYLSNSETWLRK